MQPVQKESKPCKGAISEPQHAGAAALRWLRKLVLSIQEAGHDYNCIKQAHVGGTAQVKHLFDDQSSAKLQQKVAKSVDLGQARGSEDYQWSRRPQADVSRRDYSTELQQA